MRLTVPIVHFLAVLTHITSGSHHSHSQSHVNSSVHNKSHGISDNAVYKHNKDPPDRTKIEVISQSASNISNLFKERESDWIFRSIQKNHGNSSVNVNRNRRQSTTARSIDDSDTGSDSEIQAISQSRLNTPPAPAIYRVDYQTATVDGLRLEFVEKGVTYEKSGASVVLANVEISIRLFGKGFTKHTVVRFATELKSRGADCDDTSSTKTFTITEISTNVLSSAVVGNVIFPPSQEDEYYYVCIRENSVDMAWVHQGPDAWLTIKAYQKFLPFWLQILFICILLMLSGLFAGLTLGLLALDRTDLQILANTGTETERSYAKTIMPLRRRGNYLLCSLVLGNVLVNSTLTILLDDLTSGIIAVISSTAGIVIFGEIIPQAVCSRNGLAIGARTVWVTKFLMLITFPLSYTISVILDRCLGEEIGIVYTREKLKELVALTRPQNNLETDEVNIISGALSLNKKTVENVMTRLEDVFMLPMDGVLNFETLTEVRKLGYSRIPVFEGERTNIVSLLFTKDLVFIDPNSQILLKNLSEFYSPTLFFILAETTLDIVFKEFRESKRGHMAFVQRINRSQDDVDPFCETIGLVTLEDVIEELIQSEIVDETDVWVDNRSKKRIQPRKKQDFSKFMEIRSSNKSEFLTPQLALAAFQYLTTVLKAFKSPFMSENVLFMLLKKNIITKIQKSDYDNVSYIYESGKPAEFFMIVLEGRIEVKAGTEQLKYEAGPFTYFGSNFLLTEPSANGDCFHSKEPGSSSGCVSLICKTTPHTFIPDYSVRPVTEIVCLRLKYRAYMIARAATDLERSYLNDPAKAAGNPNWQADVENVLKAIDEETVTMLPEGRHGYELSP